jgi:FemAB-related protein (PEP-CTERM system-associated)
MRLELAPTVDEQWNCFDSKLRAQVRRSEKEGATIRVGSADKLRDFYKIFSRNMRDLGTPVYSRSFFERVVEHLRESVEIVIVYFGEIPGAAAFLIHYDGRTEIPWASSNRIFNPLGVNMLLYWSCIRRAIQRGSNVFDFGRSSKDSGTFRFKKQWGARPIPMYWHYWLESGKAIPSLRPDNPDFAIAIQLWRKLPLPVANAVGPLIVKHLP